MVGGRHVLTTAHCVDFRAGAGSWVGRHVVVGDHDQQISDGETTVEIQNVIVHPSVGYTSIGEGGNFIHKHC